MSKLGDPRSVMPDSKYIQLRRERVPLPSRVSHSTNIQRQSILKAIRAFTPETAEAQRSTDTVSQDPIYVKEPKSQAVCLVPHPMEQAGLIFTECSRNVKEYQLQNTRARHV